MKLWHYTCEHGMRGIRRDGYLKPHPHPFLRTLPPMVWLTDLDTPDVHALGLSNAYITCDRTAHVLEVDVADPQHWPRVAHDRKVNATIRGMMETGRLPMHWYLSFEPIRAWTLAQIGPS